MDSRKAAEMYHFLQQMKLREPEGSKRHSKEMQKLLKSNELELCFGVEKADGKWIF